MGRSKDGVSEAAHRIEESHEQEMRFLRGWRKRAEKRARSVDESRPPTTRLVPYPGTPVARRRSVVRLDGCIALLRVALT
jgi:hypothetical protein